MAPLPGCGLRYDGIAVVSLRSTTGYRMGCLLHRMTVCLRHPDDGMWWRGWRMVRSQAAILVFFPTATRARGVTSDFSGQADNVVGLGDFSDEAIVFLEYGNPLRVHEVLD